MKINLGSIKNEATGISKEIVVKKLIPNKVKDLLIGGAVIGVGIYYLTAAAFKDGLKEFEEAENKTLRDLDLIVDVPKEKTEP